MQYPKISEYVKASQDASDNLNMSTEATDEELNEAITDEFGVKYSKDGRKLLKAPKKLDGIYSIRKGTKVVCDRAFCLHRSLAEVVISNSVTSIGDHAFYGCSSLAEVIIPNSVTSIGNYVFSKCSSLSSIVIPDSVNSIGEGAFLNCSSLSSIVIPDSVNSIGDGAFSDCSSLSSIVIPNSVNSIGEGAFLNCSSLSSIVIPDSVNNIRRGAFYKCNLPYNLKQNFISRFSNELFMFPLKIPGFKSLYNYSKKNYGDN